MKTKGKGGMKTYFSMQNDKKKKNKNNWALKVDTKIYCTVSIRAPQRAPMGRETKKKPHESPSQKFNQWLSEILSDDKPKSPLFNTVKM